MKYPDECPVFEFCDGIYEGVPWMFEYAQEVDGDITLLGEDGKMAYIICLGDEGVKPLTPAARELLTWAAQS